MSSTITLTRPSNVLASLTDAELLQGLSWERGADPALKVAAESGNPAVFQRELQSALQPQITGRETTLGCGARTLWSLPAFPDEAELGKLLTQVAGLSAKSRGRQKKATNKAPKTLSHRVEPLLRHFFHHLDDDEASKSVRPLAAVAALEVLALAGARLRPAQLWKVWKYALSQVVQLPSIHADVDAHDPTLAVDVQLIERGELPFIAGVLFSGVSGAEEMIRAGRKVLGRSLTENADGDGTPRAEVVERLPLWLAPLIRATLIARRFDVRLWTNDQERLLRLAVERAIPLCRPDGRLALSNGLPLEPLPVLVAAAELFGLPSISPEGSYLQSVKRVAEGQPARRSRNNGVAMMPSNQSDWARVALLRSDWSLHADSVAVAHHRPFPQIDVITAGRPLFHGDWTLSLTLSGTPVELAKEWSCVCWQSDPDADYIELQMRGPGKLRVERIIMLSRRDRFMLMADSVSGAANERIEYCASVPLAEDILVRFDTPTREAQLSLRGFKARIFPLAVAQDRVQSSPHEFSGNEQQLTLKQVAQGEGLFAPILIDWNPDRTRADAQWRTLTVTEDGRVVGSDVAAGHRIKLGDLQLLIYRSLKSTGNPRAVLGHHTPNETVIARVDKKGDVDPILLVEHS